MDKTKNLLEVRNLTVHYETDEGICEAVNDISFDIHPGEILGVVGETGAGKTTIALSIMGLLPKPPAHVISGSIKIEGNEMLSEKPEAKGFFDFARKKARKRDEKRLESIYRTIRGKKVSMMFQDPMTALNPVLYVGDQIAEVIRIHEKISEAEAEKRAGEMLELVGIPRDRYKEYPHQFSGGMKQRVVIAIALVCRPDLIIADEPTTALDVTIQAQILEMMNDIKKTHDGAIMLITHDLGVVAQMCDRVAIVYAGEILEIGTVQQVYKNILHPYTKGLFESLPGYSAGKRLKQIDGLMPDPSDLPPLCKFEPRCPYSCEQCKKEMPQLVDMGDGHMVRCLRAQKGQV